MTSPIVVKTGKFRDAVHESFPHINLNLCLTCGACTGGCPASESYDLDPRKFLRMMVLGLDDEIYKNPWIWACTMCARCSYVCPMEIDIPRMIYKMRASVPREERPKGILGSCDNHIKAGNAMGVPDEDFMFTVEDVIDECREMQPEFSEMKATINRKGAYYLLNQNSREPVTEPDEMLPLLKILHKVGADWTYPSVMWGGENYCMFLADDEGWRYIIETFVDHVHKLGCKEVINTECGHAYYAILEGMRKFNVKTNFKFVSIVSLYGEWIRNGVLKINRDWNKDLKIKFTLQDPCNLIRKSNGDPMADEFRYIVKQLVGEENFVDMYPNKSNNYCCGGGGGALQAGFPDHRKKYGKIKFDQIMETGASYVITPCHNCHAQIEDMCHEYGGSYHTVHLWTIICLSMGILGENERTYLGPDLAEFGL